MKVEDAIALVSNSIRDDTGYEEDIKTYFMECQEFFERHAVKPWFLHKSADMELTTEGYILFPPDFISEIEGERFYILDDDGWPRYGLKKVEFSVAIDQYNNYTCRPKFYAVRPGRWIFFPKPDKVYIANNTYIAKEPLPDSIRGNRWLEYASDLLVAYATMRLAGSLKEADLFQSASQQVQQSWARIVADTYNRLSINLVPGLGTVDVDTY